MCGWFHRLPIRKDASNSLGVGSEGVCVSAVRFYYGRWENGSRLIYGCLSCWKCACSSCVFEVCPECLQNKARVDEWISQSKTTKRWTGRFCRVLMIRWRSVDCWHSRITILSSRFSKLKANCKPFRRANAISLRKRKFRLINKYDCQYAKWKQLEISWCGAFNLVSWFRSNYTQRQIMIFESDFVIRHTVETSQCVAML